MHDPMMLTEVAEALGVTRRRVLAMIRQGQLRSELRTSDLGVPFHVVSRAEVESLRAERERRKAGERPPGLPGPPPGTLRKPAKTTR